MVVLSSVSVVFVSECVHMSPWILLLNGFFYCFIVYRCGAQGERCLFLSRSVYTFFLSSTSLKLSVFKGPEVAEK